MSSCTLPNSKPNFLFFSSPFVGKKHIRTKGNRSLKQSYATLHYTGNFTYTLFLILCFIKIKLFVNKVLKKKIDFKLCSPTVFFFQFLELKTSLIFERENKLPCRCYI